MALVDSAQFTGALDLLAKAGVIGSEGVVGQGSAVG